tara:strand:- start:2261 stop:3334 length:1074 start_codon:yes stop_codon:yes gene_type:complete
MELIKFWKNKNVLVTGHNGFKGSWLSCTLLKLGANVTGISLPDLTNPSMYASLDLNNKVNNINLNIEDYDSLDSAIKDVNPEIIFHLAAQPLVGESYKFPRSTFNSNTMGTLNILECIRENTNIRSSVIVTSDKCYLNQDSKIGYVEDDKLGGHDPYSASKAAAEIITQSYIKSYFTKEGDASRGVASARAGNVIGGGDWSHDRIIPDIVRSSFEHKKLIIRNPNGVRPWQHVLDSVMGYIKLSEKLFNEGRDFNGAWNFGPYDYSVKPVIDIIKYFEDTKDLKVDYELTKGELYKETNLLLLDSTKAIENIGWKPVWNIDETLDKTYDWYCRFYAGDNIAEFTDKQIDEYLTHQNQ